MGDQHASNTQTTTNTLHFDTAALSRRKFLTILGGTSAAAALTTLPGSSLSPVLARDEERRNQRPLTELTTMSATALARAIRQKRVSSREVAQAYLDRIDQVNPQINAVVQLRHDAALAEADAADTALSR